MTAELSTPPIMLRLREETATHHKHAESRQLEQSLLRGTLPRDGYVEVLKQRFVIHRALESHVSRLRDAHPWVAALVEPRLLQEANLRRDLEHLGVDAESVESLPAARRLMAEIERLASSHALALLGVYYVFEGSKNGARYIAKSVRGAYRLSEGPGTLYLDPHGEAQRPLWQQFKERMNVAPLSPADGDAIVAAAQRTFEFIAELDDEILPLCGT